MIDPTDPACSKRTLGQRTIDAALANRITSTAVLAWACWLITRIADQVFADPAAINLHTVSALALIVGILASVIALWQWVRAKVAGK